MKPTVRSTGKPISERAFWTEQLRKVLAETLCSAFFEHCENVKDIELYVYEDYRDVIAGITGRELTDALIVMSLEASGLGRYQVERTDRGKPYIRNCDRGRGEGCGAGCGGGCGEGCGAGGELHVSVSHSGR